MNKALLWCRQKARGFTLLCTLFVGLGVGTTSAQQRAIEHQIQEVGHWAFEGNLNDDSASQLHGTLKDKQGSLGTPFYIPGVSPNTQALELNWDLFVDVGDTDDPNITSDDSPLNFAYNQPFSVSAWVRRGEVATKSIVLGRMETLVTPDPGWALFFEDENDDLYFNFRKHSGGPRVKVKTSTNQIPADLTGEFYHIVMTYDGSGSVAGTHLYINMNEDTTPDFSGGLSGPTTTEVSFNIGSRDNNTPFNDTSSNDNAFYGHIDEVRIFKGALLSVDIQCLNHVDLRTTCKPGDLYWGHGVWGQDWQ